MRPKHRDPPVAQFAFGCRHLLSERWYRRVMKLCRDSDTEVALIRGKELLEELLDEASGEKPRKAGAP